MLEFLYVIVHKNAFRPKILFMFFFQNKTGLRNVLDCLNVCKKVVVSHSLDEGRMHYHSLETQFEYHANHGRFKGDFWVQTPPKN